MSKRFFVDLYLVALSLFVALSLLPQSVHGAQASGRASKPNAIAVLDWFKMNRAQFGCYLHKSFGVRDRNWNCKHRAFKSSGDPCKNTLAYYAGPSFPEQWVKKLSPHLSNIDLQWEHGDLQAVSFDFVDKVSEAQARKMTGLPDKGVPASLMSIDLQDCSLKSTCLIIQKFDHLGAGEAECGE